MFTTEDVARVCHEANRAMQVACRDPRRSPPWDDATAWHRSSAYASIHAVVQGATPEEVHEAWMLEKAEQGWVYGDVKDEEAKTHPCLVPYGELPLEQRAKDAVFHAIVKALEAVEG